MCRKEENQPRVPIGEESTVVESASMCYVCVNPVKIPLSDQVSSHLPLLCRNYEEYQCFFFGWSQFLSTLSNQACYMAEIKSFPTMHQEHWFE